MSSPTFLVSLQSEMRSFGGIDIEALKQQFGKKILELEQEKRIVQVRLNIVLCSSSIMRLCYCVLLIFGNY